jgi:hypothetical protein
MSSTRYKKHAGGAYTLQYHFVWCPKYRRKVLHGAILERQQRIGEDVALGVDQGDAGAQLSPQVINERIEVHASSVSGSGLGKHGNQACLARHACLQGYGEGAQSQQEEQGIGRSDLPVPLAHCKGHGLLQKLVADAANGA